MVRRPSSSPSAPAPPPKSTAHFICIHLQRQNREAYRSRTQKYLGSHSARYVLHLMSCDLGSSLEPIPAFSVYLDPRASLDPRGEHSPLQRILRQRWVPHAPLLFQALWCGGDRAIRGQRLRALGSRLHRLPVGKAPRLAPTRRRRPSYPGVAACV